MKKLFPVALAGVLAFLAVIAFAREASAFCGFYVSGADTKMWNNATQVVLMRDGLRTVLSMQNNYEGPPENFALVVPVPVVLQQDNVKILPLGIFDRVDQLDAPRLVEYWEQDPCAPPMPPAMAFRRSQTAGMHQAGPGAGGKGLGVTVEAEFIVGEYQVVILSAKDATGLDTWLKTEGYKIPEGAAPYFKPYIDQGSKFFVAKVDVTKVKFVDGMAALSPLRFHYDSDRFSLPVRLGLMNSKGTQDLIVHILAKNQRYEVSNYDNVTIPTNVDVAESARAEFGSFYASLFDRTLEKNPKAVITEYAWSAATCDPCPTPALTQPELVTLGSDAISLMNAVDAGAPVKITPVPGAPVLGPGMNRRGQGPRGQWQPWVITRLHARYTKDSLGEDLVFRAADPITGGREVMTAGALEHGSTPATVNNFQARYAIRHAWPGPIACKEPHRGVWGGPWPVDGGAQSVSAEAPQAARGLAFAKRDPNKLASYVTSRVPELGLEGVVAGAAPSASPANLAPATTTDVPPPKKDCGCSVVTRTRADPIALGIATLLGAALLVRRRRRS